MTLRNKPDLSVEAGRLYRVLCQALVGGCPPPEWSDLSPAEWDALAALAGSEGVAPLLYVRFRQHGWPPGITPAARQSLTRAYYDSAAHNQVLFSELERILAALDTARTPVILLKGAALASTCYPDPALRPMTDLDLLAPRAYLEKAIAALQEAGYRKQNVTYHVVLFGGPRDSVTVELHWSLMVGGAGGDLSLDDWFWEQSAPRAGGLGRALSPAAHLLYLAAHLILQHGADTPRLVWFYDLHLLASRWGSELDWEALLLQARALGWGPALSEALLGAQARFGTPLPPQAAVALAEAEATCRPARKQTLNRWMWDALGSLSARTRLHMALNLLFPAPTYMRWRYKPRPEWLWPAFYPYRWWLVLRDTLSLSEDRSNRTLH